MNTLSKIKGTMARPLQIGFLGLGWIGQNRMNALLKSGIAEASVIADPVLNSDIYAHCKNTTVCSSIEELLTYQNLDGIVIATPSALHAEQTIAALESNFAVFCQKPLGRSWPEVVSVVQKARDRNRLLGIDFSYRYLEAVQVVKQKLEEGCIGEVFAVRAVFHNAYGPDKDWFYNWRLSGGGCVIDLGIHLVDLVLYLFNFPEVSAIMSRLYSKGKRIEGQRACVEDFATAQFEFSTGCIVQMECSWKLSAGTDALIGIWLYGTRGALSIHNVNGSFYDFCAEHLIGTQSNVLCSQPDHWCGRAIEAWATQLRSNNQFDESVATVEMVSFILDSIYRGSKM